VRAPRPQDSPHRSSIADDRGLLSAPRIVPTAFRTAVLDDRLDRRGRDDTVSVGAEDRRAAVRSLG
jgi:hypothetical protein